MHWYGTNGQLLLAITSSYTCYIVCVRVGNGPGFSGSGSDRVRVGFESGSGLTIGPVSNSGVRV